jgi:D-hexose-6-phosphate mutarotase
LADQKNSKLKMFFTIDFPFFQVTGLAGCTFIDKTREPPNSYQECRDVVTVNEWTDRIYTNTPPEHIITNVVSGRKMRIQERRTKRRKYLTNCGLKITFRDPKFPKQFLD